MASASSDVVSELVTGVTLVTFWKGTRSLTDSPSRTLLIGARGSESEGLEVLVDSVTVGVVS